MPGRTHNTPDYRYGFNGKEKDEGGEFGNLTHYDYGFRIYNPGIARFLSVDPLTREYAYYTPYQFAGNTPIWAIDLDGSEPNLVPLILKAYLEPKTVIKDAQEVLEGTVKAAGNLIHDLAPIRIATPEEVAEINEAGGSVNYVIKTFRELPENIKQIPDQIKEVNESGTLAEKTEANLTLVGTIFSMFRGKTPKTKTAKLAMQASFSLSKAKLLNSIPLAKRFADQKLPPYFKTTSLDFSVKGEIFEIAGNKLNGNFAFVITNEGKLKIGPQFQGVHFELAEGASSVRAAGNLSFKGGVIQSVDNVSGHFRKGNTVKHTDDVLDVLDQSELIPIETRVLGNKAQDFPTDY